MQLRMPFRLPDNSEAMLVICSESCRIVSQDIRKNLFVALLPCCVKRRRKEGFGNSLSSASKVNIRTDDTDMIESMCIRGKWGHALETNDCVIAGPHSDMKNVSWCESFDIRTFGFDTEWCVEQRK